MYCILFDLRHQKHYCCVLFTTSTDIWKYLSGLHHIIYGCYKPPTLIVWEIFNGIVRTFTEKTGFSPQESCECF